MTVVFAGQATVTFPDSKSTTESKLINAWLTFLRDHARLLVHLFLVLTNAERSSIVVELDKRPTNGNEETPLDVASLPSIGTALRLPFLSYLPFTSAQWGSGCYQY